MRRPDSIGLELTTDCAGRELHGVRVGKEALRIGFESGDRESSAGIGAIRENARGEWSGQAAKGLPPRKLVQVLVLVRFGTWVRKSNPRRSSCSGSCLVNVRRRDSGRGVVTLEPSGDVLKSRENGTGCKRCRPQIDSRSISRCRQSSGRTETCPIPREDQELQLANC